MKKLAILMTVCAMTLFNSQLHAGIGQGAAQGTDQSDSFVLWTIGIGALAVIATMTGIIVASSTETTGDAQVTASQSH